jgi:hypothetical protein
MSLYFLSSFFFKRQEANHIEAPYSKLRGMRSLVQFINAMLKIVDPISQFLNFLF